MTVIATLPIIWLGVILAAIFAEAVFENLILLWFAPAAAISLVCGLLNMSPRGQVTVFLVSAVAMIVLARIISIGNKRRRKNIRDDSDIK